jgi:hypothetical protein
MSITQKRINRVKLELFELLREQLPHVTDREVRILGHLVRDEAIKSCPPERARKLP